MLKSTKRFTLSTEAPNAYGFRVITNGIDLSLFRSNPVMLWMHQRAASGNKNDILPLGYWADLEVKEGKITAVPVFDEKDAFAVSIYNKVENGTLRMASAGLMPLQFEEKGGSKALTKSILKEASIVDIGANAEALAVALYDAQDKLIKLADYAGLSTGGNPANKSFRQLWEAGELESLKAENLPLFKLKFKEQFGRGYLEPAEAKAHHKSQRAALLQENENELLTKLSAKTYNELWRTGELEQLKAKNPLLYCQKYQQHFGKLPNHK